MIFSRSRFQIDHPWNSYQEINIISRKCSSVLNDQHYVRAFTKFPVLDLGLLNIYLLIDRCVITLPSESRYFLEQCAVYLKCYRESSVSLVTNGTVILSIVSHRIFNTHSSCFPLYHCILQSFYQISTMILLSFTGNCRPLFFPVWWLRWLCVLYRNILALGHSNFVSTSKSNH